MKIIGYVVVEETAHVGNTCAYQFNKTVSEVWKEAVETVMHYLDCGKEEALKVMNEQPTADSFIHCKNCYSFRVFSDNDSGFYLMIVPLVAKT